MQHSIHHRCFTYNVLPVFSILVGALLASLSLPLVAQTNPSIHIVYMGGNDCPPCRAWRSEELPKFEASDAFSRVRFSYVNKVIRSSVPPRFFLPEYVKPLKEKLDYAANGISGSPHTVIVVDGEVYDYIFGARTASQLEAAILAIESRSELPFKRCVRRLSQQDCESKDSGIR